MSDHLIRWGLRFALFRWAVCLQREGLFVQDAAGLAGGLPIKHT